MSISQDRLRSILKYIGPKKPASSAPRIMNVLVWELMKAHTKIEKLWIKMDKKMHQITEKMKKAEGEVKKGKGKEAVKILEKAEKKNEKLVKVDKNIRDPIIEKAKNLKIKFPKDWGKVK